MNDNKRISEAKSAALDFIKGRDLSKDKLAIVSLVQAITTVAPLSSDRDNCHAISGLIASVSTPMDGGIEAATNNYLKC